MKDEKADKTGVIISDSTNLKKDMNSFIGMIKEHKVWSRKSLMMAK